MTTTVHPIPRRSIELRALVPGSTGWSVDDLDDPRIEAQWFKGHFEIIEGVITDMAPAFFAGGEAQFELMTIVRNHLGSRHTPVKFSTEVDLILGKRRVVRADAVMLTAQDKSNQAAAAAAALSNASAAVKRRRKSIKQIRILIPPTLVIESVSPGHEPHDTDLKKRWYAEFRVPNYWIVDAFAQTLICYRLRGRRYVVDCEGRDSQILRPSAFAGLLINLNLLWAEPVK